MRVIIAEIIILTFLAGVLVFLVPGFEDTRLHAAIIRTLTRASLLFQSDVRPDIYLDINFDKQDHALSCEVAVLKMLLAYRGVAVREDELINKIGFDGTRKHYSNGRLIWGNPHKAFVGDINGVMPRTGYGVYWEPVKRVANEYRTASSFTGWSIFDLASELERGNPVMIWGHLGPGTQFSWLAEDGTRIQAVNYEHVFIVHGLKGSSRNPEGFFITDPIYGKQYWDSAKLLEHWSSLGNSGVIVF